MALAKPQKSGLNATIIKNARPKNKPYKLADRDGLIISINSVQAPQYCGPG